MTRTRLLSYHPPRVLTALRFVEMSVLMPLPSVDGSSKNASDSNPDNTAFDAWLIGRCMDDDDIKKDMKDWPFKVTEKNGKPYITVKHKGFDCNFVSFFLSNIPAYFLTLRQKRNKRYDGRRKLTRLLR